MLVTIRICSLSTLHKSNGIIIKLQLSKFLAKHYNIEIILGLRSDKMYLNNKFEAARYIGSCFVKSYTIETDYFTNLFKRA